MNKKYIHICSSRFFTGKFLYVTTPSPYLVTHENLHFVFNSLVLQLSSFFISFSLFYTCIGVVLQVHAVSHLLMPIRNLGLHTVFRVRAVSCVNLNMEIQAGRDLDSL